MEIFNYISTRTYFIRKNLSVSIIFDSKNFKYYLLKGLSSDLWNIIVETKNFSKFMEYALQKFRLNEIEDFLSELKDNKIISINKIFSKSTHNFLSNTISIASSNFDYFYDNWTRFTIYNDLINTLILELNYRCNQHCIHCYNHKNMDEYNISFDWAKKAIDQAYNLGISLVKLTGGECTLNKDFLKIAKYVKSKKLELQINTNGIILNDNNQLFDEVINLYPSKIQISLYSTNPAIHDYITGVNGSFEKTANVCKKLAQAGVNVAISTVILSYNSDCYRDVSNFAKEIGVKNNFSSLFIYNPQNNNLAAKPSIESLEQYFKEELKKKKTTGRIDNCNSNDIIICKAGLDRLCINPKLDILPCTDLDYILGNLKTTTLDNIKSTTLKEFREKSIKKNLKECFNEEYCTYCSYCHLQGCFNNSFLNKQPILCEHSQALYNAVIGSKN